MSEKIPHQTKPHPTRSVCETEKKKMTEEEFLEKLKKTPDGPGKAIMYLLYGAFKALDTMLKDP